MKQCVWWWVVCVVCVTSFSASVAQERTPRGNRLVVRDRVSAHWSQSGDRFWYRNDLADGEREFILVDALKGQRSPAFDHGVVATYLGNGAQADKLPIDSIEFAKEPEQLILIGSNQRWSWNLATAAIGSADGIALERAEDQSATGNSPISRTGAETELTFDNRSSEAIEIFWLDGEGGKRSYGKVAAGQRKDQHTFGGHRWQIVNAKGESLGEVIANDTPTLIAIDGSKLAQPSRPRRNRPRNFRGSSGTSPSGKWLAEIREHNVHLRAADSQQWKALTSDGLDTEPYDQISWSPDSKTLVAWKVQPVERQSVHLVRSSPSSGGRAVLESRPYTLPGDPFPRYAIHLFSIEQNQHLIPEVDRFEHEWQQPQLHWSQDSQHVAYEQTDRGHQRMRVIDIDTRSGQVRNLVDERSQTFIWTAHTENNSLAPIYWLDKSAELIHVSEKNGWRHLYLIDAATGQEKNAITTGQWVIRGIDQVDQELRQIWFRASGCFDQDPYLIHYGRVNFDGSGLTWLTAGNGNHSIEYSPDRRFIVDTYSRVDLPPVIELRRTADGQKVCDLESADVSRLKADGWSSPEVFVAKGRDQTTDIWGIICRPKDYDPRKKYPIIEDIYAGPQGSFVPKSFSPSQRYSALNQLGFIVVKIDGMGTANRSKAFHDVCWHNLKDGGFLDRIAWINAAASRYPEMDKSRVGIFGTSAGGQNAAAAVIFHPEFYKAAVASCGCHDNRMDKASWNEQWMGYPVGQHYSECSNIDNAHRLGGKLLLIVGEMDTNVPPESTLRLADALIRADKDFDLLVVPNAGHGNGGPYGVRRMHEFFVRHLAP